jgi:hypothetical protein
MADVLAARDGSKPTYSATAASDQEDSRSGGSAWRKVLRARSARVFSFVAVGLPVCFAARSQIIKGHSCSRRSGFFTTSPNVIARLI